VVTRTQIDIDVGTIMQMELSSDEERPRVEVALIGYLTENSILVTAPDKGGVTTEIKVDDPVTLRYMAGNDIFAFTTKVQKLCSEPFPYLHLRYPVTFDVVPVRKAQRVETNIEIVVARGGAPIGDAGVVLRDLSATGCKVVSKLGALGQQDDILSLSIPLRFSGMHEKLRVAAVVRTVIKLDSGDGEKLIQHGLEFGKLDQQQRLFINGYVYEQLALGRSS